MSKLLCFNFFFKCRVTNLLISKYVDSHLRPFRCKVKSCVGVQFSSTACLLRHEREAHGMHGHGSKPHLCTYTDCERSLPGNGFPRRYNLFDHMKRVHDYTGSTSPPEQVSPPVQPAQLGPKRHNSTNKRKLAPPVEDMARKRQKTTTKAPSAATAAASTQHRLAQEKQRWRREWAERKARLQQRVENIQGPQDINSCLQAYEDLDALKKIAARLNELGWMQYRVLFSRFHNLERSLFVLNIAGFVPMPWISQECFCYGFAWLPSCYFLLFFKPGFKATDYHREDLPSIPEHIPLRVCHGHILSLPETRRIRMTQGLFLQRWSLRTSIYGNRHSIDLPSWWGSRCLLCQKIVWFLSHIALV